MPAKEVTSLHVALTVCLCVSTHKTKFWSMRSKCTVLCEVRTEFSCMRQINIFFKDVAIAVPVTEKARLRSPNQTM